MKKLKIWPHLVILGVLCGGAAGAGATLWLKHRQNRMADLLPAAARMERVDGDVALDRSLDHQGADGQWVRVTPNTPVSVGDRIYTRDNARAALAFTGRNFARLNPKTSLDVISLSNRRTQLALRDGSAIFNVGSPSDSFEVATPGGAIDLEQPGLYQVAVGDDGNTVVSVLSGLAQVVGSGGTGQVGRGEALTLLGQSAAQIVLSRLDPGLAGNLADDYYRYQYPRAYDGRYRSYDAYLSDPYYYDPSRHDASYQYVADTIPGVEDLSSYGDWQNVSGYGYCWHPRVDQGWAPYREGYWTAYNPYGLTWVSSEPWGFAPYHYGRWANLNGQWFWVPERPNTRPVYAPALVAFVPLSQSNEIGWAPLGPGETYTPRYYDGNWQAHYLDQRRVTQSERIANLSVPGAVTAVPAQDFTRVIDRGMVARVDAQSLAHARPVLDPLAVETVRQAALQAVAARRRVNVPEAVVQRIYNTPVVAGTAPAAQPFRANLAQALRVEPVPESRRSQRLQISDRRTPAGASQPSGSRPQEAIQAPPQMNVPASGRQDDQRVAVLATEAARGERGARRQLQQLQAQQQTRDRAGQDAASRQAAAQQSQAADQRAQQVTIQREQRAQTHREQQGPGQSARQQVIAEQQRAATRQQTEAQRQARRPASTQQPQQTDTARLQKPWMRLPEPPGPRTMGPPAASRQPRASAPAAPQVRPQPAPQKEAQKPREHPSGPPPDQARPRMPAQPPAERTQATSPPPSESRPSRTDRPAATRERHP